MTQITTFADVPAALNLDLSKTGDYLKLSYRVQRTGESQLIGQIRCNERKGKKFSEKTYVGSDKLERTFREMLLDDPEGAHGLMRRFHNAMTTYMEQYHAALSICVDQLGYPDAMALRQTVEEWNAK